MVRAALLLVLLVGCPGPTDPPISDGSLPGDASLSDTHNPGAARLTIAWAIKPAVDVTTAAGNELDDVKFRMENLKATVDVDPEDPNTTKDEYELHWDSDDEPESITFENATPGRYTSITLELAEGDGEASLDIRGDDDDNDTFKIDDSASHGVVMSFDAMLEPGAEMTLTIEIDLEALIDPIDFDSLPADDGVDHHLDIDEDMAQMLAFRGRIPLIFSVR